MSAVHQPQNSSSATVRNFKQHGAVSLVHVLRFVKIEVRGKLDFSLRVARSLVQIHDLPVVNVFRTHRKVHSPGDLFVCARQSERTATLNVVARKNLHARDMRVSCRSRENEHRKSPHHTSAQGNHEPPPKAPQLTASCETGSPLRDLSSPVMGIVHFAERNRRISRITFSPRSVWKRNCACSDPSTIISSFGSGAFSYCARIPGSRSPSAFASSRATMNSDGALSFSAGPFGDAPRN